jgi:hypothetical protein
MDCTTAHNNTTLEKEMKSLLIVAGLALIVAGCATHRPPMPEDHYMGFAGKWLVVDYCTWKGWMDTGIAAKGRQYINADISTWTYDLEKLKGHVISLKSEAEKLNQGDCRRMESSIQERAHQIDNQNATTAIQQQEAQNMINSTKTTQTYCNKIGTQVFCNSF